MRAIRFLRHCGTYNAGEVATFNDATAQRYVERGIATYVSNDLPPTLKIDAAAEPEPSSRVPPKMKTR